MKALVLVANEVTEGGRYDFWDDDIFDRYHYPNGYKSKIIKGTPFLYFKGTRRVSGRQIPEYFGHGVIGEIWQDPATANLPKKNWKWYCKVEAVQLFYNPVPFRLNDKLFEEVPSQAYWRNAVREIPLKTYQLVISIGGATLPVAEKLQEMLPRIDDVDPILDKTLDRFIPIESSIVADKEAIYGAQRHSSKSLVVGKRGEEVVIKLLRNTLEPEEANTIIWQSDLGKTPGYDISYTASGNGDKLIEVKSGVKDTFKNFEISANEWAAAEQHREAYSIYMVFSALSKEPVIQVLNNPYDELNNNRLSVTPIIYRASKIQL